MRSRIAAAARPAIRKPDSHSAVAAGLMCVNSVVATSVPDSITRTLTMTAASTFSQGGLTHGPSTSGSLQSSSRNTLALGSSTPASACTPVGDQPERRVRDEHHAGRQQHSAA